MEESWKSIIGYDGRYFISSLGRIKSFVNSPFYQNNSKGTILKQHLNRKGYFMTYLSLNGKTKTFVAHRLVALHFVENISGGDQVNHKNGIKNDNRFENLEWVTCRQNIQHAFDSGIKTINGDKHPRSVFTNKQVIEARKMFAAGSSIRELADKYGKMYGTMWRVLKNINYASV